MINKLIAFDSPDIEPQSPRRGSGTSTDSAVSASSTSSLFDFKPERLVGRKIVFGKGDTFCEAEAPIIRFIRSGPGQSCRELSAIVRKCSDLRAFALNESTDLDGFDELMDALQENATITHLQFIRHRREDRYFTKPQLNRIVVLVKARSTGITHLSLKVGNLSLAMSELADVLRGNETLRRLYLDHSHLTDEDACVLAGALRETQVLSLALTANQIGNIGAKAVVEASKANLHLRGLSLSSNPITDPFAEECWQTLSETSLEFFDCDVDLSNEGISYLLNVAILRSDMTLSILDQQRVVQRLKDINATVYDRQYLRDRSDLKEWMKLTLDQLEDIQREEQNRWPNEIQTILRLTNILSGELIKIPSSEEPKGLNLCAFWAATLDITLAG